MPLQNLGGRGREGSFCRAEPAAKTKGHHCLPSSSPSAHRPCLTWLLAVVRLETFLTSGLESPMGPLQHGLQLVLQRVPGAGGKGLASTDPGFLPKRIGRTCDENRQGHKQSLPWESPSSSLHTGPFHSQPAVLGCWYVQGHTSWELGQRTGDTAGRGAMLHTGSWGKCVSQSSSNANHLECPPSFIHSRCCPCNLQPLPYKELLQKDNLAQDNTCWVAVVP